MESTYDTKLADFWIESPPIVHCRIKLRNYSETENIVEFYNILEVLCKSYGKIHLVVHDLKIGPTKPEGRSIVALQTKKYISKTTIISQSKLMKSIFLFTRLFRTGREIEVQIITKEDFQNNPIFQ
ncbi:MAG: hypothetical protein KJ941_03780 [Bacteroidetes bacterium]|nr:hypothetical protein [Bacteroidota bacterium]